MKPKLITMKQSVIILLMLPLFINAQSIFTPNVEVGNFRIQDILLTDTSTIYCTTKSIFEVKEDNSTVLIDGAQHSTVYGHLTETEEGWVYLGHTLLGDDYWGTGYHINVYSGDSLYSKTIPYYLDFDFDFDYEIKAMAYQSIDTIYGLLEDAGDYYLAIIDREGEITDIRTLSGSGYTNIIYQKDNTLILVGRKKVQLIKNLEVINSYSADDIIDVNYHKEEGIIEVLTESDIFMRDELLSPLYIIELPPAEGERVSSYYENEINYVLSHEDGLSYISAFDSSGAKVYVHESLLEHTYSDLLIQDSRFNVWGENDCWGSNNFVKMDIDGFGTEIVLNNLTVDFFDVNLDSIVYDTITLNSGNEVTSTNLIYSWEMLILNSGINSIDGYSVVSNRNKGRPMVISFDSDAVLEPGQSKEHTGSMSSSESNFTSYIHLSVYSDLLDESCEDNQWKQDLLTNTAELEVEDWYVYPNPASELINLSFEEDFEYRIMDVAGRCLKKSTSYNSQIDVSSLSNGIYFLSVSINGKRSTIARFVKSR
ncbi:MAG: hypothetical protein ACJATI_000398 [Halioglobus sp.]|jgi:hypothetical protein